MPDTTMLVAVIVLAAIAFAFLIAWVLETLEHGATLEALEQERTRCEELERDVASLVADVHDLEAAYNPTRSAVPFDQEA